MVTTTHIFETGKGILNAKNHNKSHKMKNMKHLPGNYFLQKPFSRQITDYYFICIFHFFFFKNVSFKCERMYFQVHLDASVVIFLECVNESALNQISSFKYVSICFLLFVFAFSTA